jgi:hypothetical protein
MAEGKKMAEDRTSIASSASPIDARSVFGWGVDADPENDPTYPYRDRSGDRGLAQNWEPPSAQESDVEVLQSVEYVRRPAVFGTSTPPSGLSGMVRRAAFRWSESNWLHWLLLMGADRINVVEGVVDDLAHGRVPNIPAEMGARAEWRHNRMGFITKSAAVLGVAAGLFALASSRRSAAAGEEPATRPQLAGEGGTTRFGMEDGDNTDIPATGGTWPDPDSGPR